MGAVGLKTHIWANNTRSILLLAGFPVLLFLIIYGLELILMGRESRRITLGPVAQGCGPVAVVPSGELQAARTSGDYTLAACFVAPGFEFADFSMPSRNELLRELPDQRNLILEFTR